MFAAFLLDSNFDLTFSVCRLIKIRGMSNTTNNTANREVKAAAKSLLSAVDRLIVAAKQAERARNQLERVTENKQR